jgi:hypothetical protein
MKQKISSQTTQTNAMISSTTSGLTVGIDLGDQWSQFCLLDAARQIQQEGRVKSRRSAFQARFGTLTPARIALETGTHSLWASELLTKRLFGKQGVNGPCSIPHCYPIARAPAEDGESGAGLGVPGGIPLFPGRASRLRGPDKPVREGCEPQPPALASCLRPPAARTFL